MNGAMVSTRTYCQDLLVSSFPISEPSLVLLAVIYLHGSFPPSLIQAEMAPSQASQSFFTVAQLQCILYDEQRAPSVTCPPALL